MPEGDRPVRLIATDLDGTFFGPDHYPEPRSVTAMNAAFDSGIVCVAITGRSHFGGAALATSTGARLHWFIGSNGGHRLNLETGLLEERLAFDDDEIHATRGRIAAELPGCVFGFEIPAALVWEQSFLDLYPYGLGGEKRHSTGIVSETPTDVGKVFVGHPEIDTAALVEAVTPHVDESHNVTTSGATFVEITPDGADKGGALARLCAQLGIYRDEVVAFGDNLNDITLLKWAGRGVAMGNARAAAKTSADEVTASNADHGVAQVIEQIVADQLSESR